MQAVPPTQSIPSSATSRSSRSLALTSGRADTSRSDHAPVNAFSLDPKIRSAGAGNAQQIYNLSATDWRRWIGDDAAEQVRTKFGCYSIVHPGTDLRIISLNTNYWSTRNCTSRLSLRRLKSVRIAR